MYKKLSALALLLIALNSCKSYELQFPSNPTLDSKGTTLTDDIQPVSTYDEIEHLKQKLVSPSPEERLFAAERLLYLDNKTSAKIITNGLKGDNEEAAKTIMTALTTNGKKNGTHKPEARAKTVERFLEPIVGLLDRANTPILPLVYDSLRFADPEKSARLLIISLNQPLKDEIIRSQIVRGLAYAPTKKSVPFLLGLFNNKKSDLNTEINRTLYAITFQTFYTKEEWLGWWNDNKYASREQWLNLAIITQLDMLKQKDAQIEQLKTSLSTMRLDLMKIRIEQARAQHDDITVLKYLTAALDDESPLMRKYAIEQLKTLDKEVTKQLITKLVEIINQPIPARSDAKAEEDIRIQIIALLGDLGDEKVVPSLTNILSGAKEQTIRDKIYAVFGRIATPTAVAPLLLGLKSEPEPTILIILDSLDKIKSREPVPTIHEYLALPEIKNNENITRAAIELLGNLKDPTSAEIIARYLEDTRKNVRWSAANSFGRMGLPEYAPKLVKLLSDEFPDVRQIAAESLGKMSNKETIPDLVKSMLSDKDSRTRQLAAGALGRIKDASAITPLLQTMGDPDEKIASAAWAAVNAIIADNLDLMEEIGQKLELANQLTRAMEIYQKIIAHPALQADDAKARLVKNKAPLARILVGLKYYEKAIPHLQDAQKAYPEKLIFTNMLIESYKNLGQHDAAIKTCLDILPDLKVDSNDWWDIQIERLSILKLKTDYQMVISESKKLLDNPAILPDPKVRIQAIKAECEKLANPQ
ncbi:MAG: HEAT repeat domain-containing protein [Candidatus Brocadiia bacterium]